MLCIIATNCSSNEDCNKFCYWEFKNVQLDKDSEDTDAKLVATEYYFTKEELIFLASYFEKRGTKYKVCTDGTVMVKKSTVYDFKSMYLMGAEFRALYKAHKEEEKKSIR